MARNHFPAHYAENISETNAPAELIPQFTTVEYELQSVQPSGPPVFLFVVDTCLDEEELAHLRDALQQIFNLLPEEALVGLITFGTLVNVHELGFHDCPKSYVFRGDKEYSSQKVQDMLNIAPTRGGGAGQQQAQQQGGVNAAGGRQSAIGRYLLPASECTFALEQVLQDLQKDPWPVEAGNRVQRASGAALSVAIGLLESSNIPKQGSRIMTFVAGPSTIGSGKIVNLSKKESIRGHTDLAKSQAPLHKPAVEYYTNLSNRAMAIHTVVDVYACSLDQTFALEVRHLVARTGGMIVLADKFNQSVFRESLRKMFEKNPDTAEGSGSLQMGFGASIEVISSREVKISGAIGPCASMEKKSPQVAEKEIGVGGTTQWYMGGIDPSATMSFFFKVT